MGKRGLWWAVSVWVLVGSGVLLAQVTSGTVSGKVTDSTGAIIPGASVSVRNVETGINRTTTSDAQGRYQVPQLGLGMYELTASADGFQSVVRSGIEMTVGRQVAGGCAGKIRGQDTRVRRTALNHAPAGHVLFVSQVLA